MTQENEEVIARDIIDGEAYKLVRLFESKTKDYEKRDKAVSDYFAQKITHSEYVAICVEAGFPKDWCMEAPKSGEYYDPNDYNNFLKEIQSYF